MNRTFHCHTGLQRSPPTNRASAAGTTAAGTENLPERPLGGVATVFPVRPRQFIVVPLIQPPEKPARAECTHHLTRQPLLQATPLPRCHLRPQPHPAKDSGDWGNAPAARPSDRPNGQSALSFGFSRAAAMPNRTLPFRRAAESRCSTPRVPGTTCSTPTGRDCLAATPPRSVHGSTTPEPGFYSGPTPRLQRLTPTRPRQAPATKPAAEVLPALVMHFASWVTWLEGVIPQASGRMCGLPPAIVSASWQTAKFGHFGGQNTEATPYPSTTAFRRSWGQIVAPKQRFRQRLPRHLPASPCGPFMVELFTAAGFSSGPRTWSRSGSGCHQPEGSPRRHTLNEPAFSRPEAPWADLQPFPAAHRL